MRNETAKQAASISALQEPVILHRILSELPQRDLLLAQRVCRAWQTTITSSKTLLTALFLHPGSSETRQDAVGSESVPVVNPLLKQHFPRFFLQRRTWNWYYSRGSDNLGPWWGASILSDEIWDVWERQGSVVGWPLPESPNPAYMRPEASWRKMLPWLPAVSQLQVDIGGFKWGVLRCLDFPNSEDLAPKRGLQHPWMTFGLLYDLVETTWFRGTPLGVHSVLIDDSWTPAPDDHRDDPVDSTALFHTRADTQKELPSLQISGSGRLFVRFELFHDTDAELQKQRRDAVARRHRPQKGCVRTRRRTLYDDIQFTNEFHLEDGATVDGIDWDNVQNYGSRPATSAVSTIPGGSRFFKLPFFSKKS